MAGPGASEAVLVHGLWFGCWAMARVAHGLREAGHATRCFDYASIRAGLDDHAAALHRFAQRSPAATLHFVGHSLGGLVILRMLERAADLPPGRVVLLGSPLRGSAVVRKALRLPGSRRLLGSARPALDSGFDAVPAGRQIGMIAGSRSFGLGWAVGGTGGPGDGTVAVAETRAEGLTGHCVLPVTHTGLVLSAAVIRNTARFLECGHFEPAAA